MTNKEYFLISDIAKKAAKKGLLQFELMSLIIDLTIAHKQFNLDLDRLLNAPDFDFAHDIVGIQNNINRETKVVENHFLPRYAR